MNLASLTTGKLREAIKIREKIDALENELSKTLSSSRWPFVTRHMRNGYRNRVMSAEGKERIAAAQRKRWAAWRKKNK